MFVIVHQVTRHQVEVQLPDLQAGEHLTGHTGQQLLEGGGSRWVRLYEGAHENQT